MTFEQTKAFKSYEDKSSRRLNEIANSKYDKFRVLLPSATKGKVAEDIVKHELSLRGIEILQAGSTDYDFGVKTKKSTNSLSIRQRNSIERIEIKSAWVSQNGWDKIQQIRPSQEWDYLFAVLIHSDHYEILWMSKREFNELFETGLIGQHSGHDATETCWLSVEKFRQKFHSIEQWDMFFQKAA